MKIVAKKPTGTHTLAARTHESSVQYNLTVSGFFSQPNIPELEFSRSFFSFFLLVTFCATFIFYCAREAPSSLRLQSFSCGVCVCVCVSPANVTVMLTGVAHEAIHLLQPQLRLLLCCQKRKLLLQNCCINTSFALELEQQQQHMSVCVCVCAPGVCLCLRLSVCVCVCVPGLLHHHLCKYLFSALFV